MALPGTPANLIPPGEDWIARELAAIRQEQREQIASVAESFQSTVQSLIALLASQVGVVGDSKSTTGISVDGAHTVKRAVSLPVPEWASKALVIAIGTINVIGVNARALRLSVEADVSGSPIIYGSQAIEGASMGPYVGTIGHTALVSPLLSTITCSVLASSEFGVLGSPAGTDGENLAHLSAVALFTR